MVVIGEFIGVLKDIKKALNDEKEALVKNNGARIAEIVKIKAELIDKLKNFKDIGDISQNEKVLELFGKINSLQETNFLLTKQALAYQEMLLESITENVKSGSNTYSARGGYNGNNEINFIDKSI